MSNENLPKENKIDLSSNQDSNKESETENSSINESAGGISSKNNSKNNSKIKKYSEILNIDIENGKEGEKVPKNDIRKKYPIYGYYVRKPIWVFYESGGGFDYEPSRNSFICLVFLIDLIMITATAGFVLLVLRNERLTEFFEELPPMIALVAIGVVMAISYSFACSPCTKKLPCNIICLLLTVVCYSIFVAFIAVKYEGEVLMYAFFATALVVLLCFLLALSPIDFTQWYLYLIVIMFAVAAAFLVVSVARIFTGTQMTTVRFLLLLGLTVLQAIFLTIELQMVLGGRAMALDEDDYAAGAFLIYTSVINLFIDILRLLAIFDEFD